MFKKPLFNNRIRAPEVRLIDQTGKQIGVVRLNEALKIANESGLDLIQLTEKISPPVCKLGDYGKYLYQQEKKKRQGSKSKIGGQLKGVRLSFNISAHDLETKACQTEKFLKKGYKVRIEMKLKGREKAFQGAAKQKITEFFESLKEKIPFKIEEELKRKPRGLITIISKQ